MSVFAYTLNFCQRCQQVLRIKTLKTREYVASECRLTTCRNFKIYSAVYVLIYNVRQLSKIRGGSLPCVLSFYAVLVHSPNPVSPSELLAIFQADKRSLGVQALLNVQHSRLFCSWRVSSFLNDFPTVSVCLGVAPRQSMR